MDFEFLIKKGYVKFKQKKFSSSSFHLVSPSPWPLYTSLTLLSLTTSGVLTFHGFAYAENNLFLSLTALILSMSL